MGSSEPSSSQEKTWKACIIVKQGWIRWWLLWLAAACLTAAVSPLGAQDGAGCSFSDVPQSSPQQADIVYACQQGWFQGYPGGTFRPDREVPQNQIATVINRAFPAGSTRADLATFLRGGNQGDPDGSADFDDVAELHPQSGDIAYAVEQGWFQGYPDGTFHPDRTITPNQIAMVASRAFPAGSTRADLATFMRRGSQALNDLTPSSPSKIAYTVPKYDSSGDQVASEEWVAEADGSGARRLPGWVSDDDYWSPDGERIAYRVGRELWVEESDGSGTRRLTDDLPYDFGVYGWSPGGERIGYRVSVYDSLGEEVAYELWVAGADGSGVRRLTNDVGWTDVGWIGEWSPDALRYIERPLRLYDVGWSWEWSPDGNRIAYNIALRDFRGNEAGQSLWVAGADGSSPRQLTDDFYRWWWSPDGERIAYLVHKQGNLGSEEYELWVVAVDGSGARRLSNGFRLDQDLEWSPDGERIAYKTYSRHTYEELWVVAVDGSGVNRLTDDVGDWEWSPDGERIVYMVKVRDNSGYKTADELWVMKLDNLMEHQLTKDFAYRWAWSSSGDRIAFESRVWEFGKWLGTGLWVVEIDGSNARQLADDIVGGWNWILSRESIIYEIKVRNSSRTVVGSELWVAGLNGSGNRQLTSDVTIYSYGKGTGDQIIYEVAVRDSSNNAVRELWVMGLDGSGNRRLANDVTRWGWSPGDGQITYTASDGGLWVVGLDGSGVRKLADYVSRWAWQPRGDGPL